MATTFRGDMKIDTVDIPVSGTETPAVVIGENTLLGFYYPDGWTTADVTIKVSHDGVQWCDVPANIGTFTGAADTYQAVDPDWFEGVLCLKLVASANQAAARTMVLVSV